MTRSKGVRFGALITILIIALPPFAQQLVQLSQKMRFDDSGGKSGTATIPCASRYSQGNRNTVFSGATGKIMHSNLVISTGSEANLA